MAYHYHHHHSRRRRFLHHLITYSIICCPSFPVFMDFYRMSGQTQERCLKKRSRLPLSKFMYAHQLRQSLLIQCSVASALLSDLRRNLVSWSCSLKGTHFVAVPWVCPILRVLKSVLQPCHRPSNPLTVNACLSVYLYIICLPVTA
jgi:hypothetical protein